MNIRSQTIATWLFSAAIGAAAPNVTQSGLGRGPDGGDTATIFTLRNGNGITARILTHGAIIAELNVPDRDGKLANIVLAPENPAQFLENFSSPAAVIGRCANRTAGARFTIDGKEYKLAANNGPNNLHGGPRHFGKHDWMGRIVPGDEAAVELSRLSPDGEEGFPGNLKVSVTYTLTDADELRLDYRATTDKPTIINLTNHAYFNLSGKDDILDHVVQIEADHYTPIDKEKIPTGEIASVAGTPFDLRKPTRIDERIDQLKPEPGGYDHNFVINGGGGKLVRAARLSHPGSGRLVEVRTTQPGVQFFTANHLAHRGACLETQHFPDSIHHANFPPVVLRPGDVGGGLAGMRVALLLTERGHRVSLYERNSDLGGQWNIASTTPGKERYASLTDRLRRALERHGVELTTGVTVTREMVAQGQPDAVVVATGAVPAGLDVPGATGPQVVQSQDVLAGTAQVNGRVVVVGGRFTGMEVAITLAEQGRDVCLVTQAGLGENGAKLEQMTFRTVARRLLDLRVPLYLHSTVLEITDRAVVMTLGDNIYPLEADTVVLAVGMRPEDRLARELEGVVPELHTLGDCVHPRDAAVVALRAAELAASI